MLRRIPNASSRLLRVMGFESSADDTCCAIVTSDRQILSNVVKKQHHVHEKFGGIHPITSQNEHNKQMYHAVRQALREANMQASELDAIAYTRGPGMFGCLQVAANSALAVAAALDKPVMAIHHMQAHALTPFLTERDPPAFPFLTLLVSGGHTLLLLATAEDRFRILSSSLDDSIGDAFDKTAKLLQLPWIPDMGPGPTLEQYARPHAPSQSLYDSIRPLPRATPRRLEFSFAGLKSATEKEARKHFSNLKLKIPELLQHAIARRFQEAAVGHVCEKVQLALEQLRGEGVDVTSLVVSGGVASNAYLRSALEALGTRVYYPPVALCTDNAAMIAWAGILKLRRKDGLEDGPNLPIRKKWPLDDPDGM